MKKRCAGSVTLLLLLGAFGVGNAKTDLHGVLSPRYSTTVIDSACLIVTPDSLTYITAGWGETGTDCDTFDFPDSLTAWPQRVWLKGPSMAFLCYMRSKTHSATYGTTCQ